MSTGAIGADCTNCGARLAGPFCAVCGQKARPPNPTLRDFAQDYATELFDYDGKIFRSVWLLFTRPGFLTREAFIDRRARYVSPIRLYLLFSVLFFAALAFAPDIGNFTYTAGVGEQVDLAAVARRENEVRTALRDLTNRWAPRVMFVLMPAFAALMMLLFRKRGRTYPQHLYFAMHVHAVVFFAATIVALANIVAIPYLTEGAKTVVLVLTAIHFARALRYAYETTWLGSLWRIAVTVVLYVAVLFGGVLMPALWYVMTRS